MTGNEIASIAMSTLHEITDPSQRHRDDQTSSSLSDKHLGATDEPFDVTISRHIPPSPPIYNKYWLARPAAASMLPRKMVEPVDIAAPAPVCGLPEAVAFDAVAFDPPLLFVPLVAVPSQTSETSSSSDALAVVEDAEEVLLAEEEAVLDAEVALAVADGRAGYG